MIDKLSDERLAALAEHFKNYTSGAGFDVLCVVAELSAMRKQTTELYGLLFVVDMFEKCSEDQHKWSGPAQAVFTAARRYRDTLSPTTEPAGPLAAKVICPKCNTGYRPGERHGCVQ